jgi:hypothetical protein
MRFPSARSGASSSLSSWGVIIPKSCFRVSFQLFVADNPIGLGQPVAEIEIGASL